MGGHGKHKRNRRNNKNRNKIVSTLSSKYVVVLYISDKRHVLSSNEVMKMCDIPLYNKFFILCYFNSIYIKLFDWSIRTTMYFWPF